MYYFFTFDFTFTSIQYIYLYQHEYLYVYEYYNIFNDMSHYIILIFFENYVYDFLSLNIFLNYLIFLNLTLTKFSYIFLYLNNIYLNNMFLKFFINSIILLFDHQHLYNAILQNLIIHVTFPYYKYTLFPLCVYYNFFYNVNYIYSNLYNLLIFSLLFN